MEETIVYKGVIREGPFGEHDDALFVADGYRPFAERVENDASGYGQYLTCRYFISDSATELSDDEVQERIAAILFGDAWGHDHARRGGENVTYHHAYSEITGYLWTDQWVVIGGHDLIEELSSHVGKWAWIEMTYSQDPTPPPCPAWHPSRG